MVAAKAIRRTARYEGGSVTATQAHLEKLFGEVPLVWKPITDSDFAKRRPYGSRQRVQAVAGEAIQVSFTDGKKLTYRVTGPHKTFLNKVLAGSRGDRVAQVISKRGSIYGPEPELEAFEPGDTIEV